MVQSHAYNPSWERKATHPSPSSELTDSDRINIQCVFMCTSNWPKHLPTGWWWLACLTAWVKRVFVRLRMWPWYAQLQESDELGSHASSRCVLDIQSSSFFRHACSSKVRSFRECWTDDSNSNHFMIQLRSGSRKSKWNKSIPYLSCHHNVALSTCARDFNRNDCVTLEYSVSISNNENNIHLIEC
jgi:hypothetical protein